MKVNEIVSQLKYYTKELPREALEDAIKRKDEITPLLLDMINYTKENIDDIVSGKDDFFGYNYAIFLLAEFKEKRLFPFIIYLLNKDESVVEYLLGDDYTEHLPRIVASVYNGDDESLFNIIENTKIDEFIRGSVYSAFAILYFNGVKDKRFFIDYSIKLIKNRKKGDNAFLYNEILLKAIDLKLIELGDYFDEIDDLISDDDFDEWIEMASGSRKIDKYSYPYKPYYQYIYDTIGIMEKWACFNEDDDKYDGENDDEYDDEYDDEDDYKYALEYGEEFDVENIKNGKKSSRENHDRYFCIEVLLSSAYEYLEKDYVEEDDEVNEKACKLLKAAFAIAKVIVKEKNIRTVDEFDEKYRFSESMLNWLQDYDDLLAECNTKDALMERIELLDGIEEIFDVDSDEYWKEFCIRGKANSLFYLGYELEATELIESYLLVKPSWVYGYVEMVDWYLDGKSKNKTKAKEILDRCKNLDGSDKFEDIDAIYERYKMIDRD